MASNFEIFKKVIPKNLGKLVNDSNEIFSTGTLESILKSYLKCIEEHKKLSDIEVKFILDWFVMVPRESHAVLGNFLNMFLEDNQTFLSIIKEYFDSLRFPELLNFLIKINFLSEKLNEMQIKSFSIFLKERAVSVSMGTMNFIDFIENLYLIKGNKFTIGQKSQANAFVYQLDFSDMFELEFERLLVFIKNCDLEYPNLVANFLDRQLGSLISRNEHEVTAKANNARLGYAKYLKFIETNVNSISQETLPNFKKLRALISKFEEAVAILTGKEQIRGQFWKSCIPKVDAVRFKKQRNNPQYQVAVAFYIGNFVFCDYGPVGNKILIYDKDVFEKEVQGKNDWKLFELLTKKIHPSSFSHIGNWQEQTLKLITEAKRI